MTPHDAAYPDRATDDSGEPPPGSARPTTASRRGLLRTLTVGGSAALAGCGLFASSAPDESSPTADGRLVTEPFRYPIEDEPATTSLYAPGFGDALDSAFALTPTEPASMQYWRFIREPGVWVDYWWVGANAQYTWLEPIEITPTAVTVTVRDDATWSDGHPITGRDIAVYPLSQLLWRHFPPYYATDEKDEPSKVLGAFDDIAVTERSVTYKSSQGYFDQFWDMTINTRFGLWGLAGDAAYPTHLNPYGAFADALIDTVKRAQTGELNPWEGYKRPFVDPEDPHRESIVKEHLGHEGKYVKRFSDPDHVVSNSAWDLVEINGPEAVFEPNPHHRNASTLNFERLVLEYTPSVEREHAALTANRLDYAGSYRSEPTPLPVVESLPDAMTQVQIPGNLLSGNEIGLNFSHPALRNRSVRAAIMYALDHEAIANNIHPSTALPVTTPGADCWDATDYAGQAWLDEHFITYTQDRTQAARLMREAGYTMDDGQWTNGAGEPITLALAAKEGTPRWEPTVASQLQAFGFDISVKALSETIFETRTDNGDFPMWSHLGFATNFAPETLVFWFLPINDFRKYEIYPASQFASGSFSRRGYPTPRTEERWRAFSVEAPPIGDPDGPLQTYHPSALTLAFYNDPPAEEFHRRVKTAMWLANWFLPTIPINKTLEQHFVDDTHWEWPTESPAWETFTNAGPKFMTELFTSGTVRANPDNPQ